MEIMQLCSKDLEKWTHSVKKINYESESQG